MTRQATVSAGATPRRGWRLLVSVAGWIALAIVAYLIWPAALGGSMSYVFVSGESMTPEYQPGDLVIARKGEVTVGDVIVYAPEGFGGAQIVHRVIGGDAEDGWSLQGDANSFVDPFTPSGDEVRGVVFAHVPGVGSAMNVLLSPFLWVSLLLIAAAIYVWPSREDEDEGAEDAAIEADDRALDESLADFEHATSIEEGVR